MNLFGKKKAATGPGAVPAAIGRPNNSVNPLDTIQELRGQLDVLDKRESLMSKRIEDALKDALAKKQKNDTKGALHALKRKKMYEAEVDKLQGSKITLDSQINALESAQINISIIRSMNRGTDAMRTLQAGMTPEAVEDITERMQEQQDLHDSISEAIARPGQDMFDDVSLSRFIMS
jgi:charged multivesicular body protein 4A/B